MRLRVRLLVAGAALVAVLLAAGAVAVPYQFGNFVWADTTWSGEVHLTGDTVVAPWATLTIKPGTHVWVAAGHDAHPAHLDKEVPPDGFNNDDPSRLRPYADTHVHLIVAGRLLAVGTAEAPITFNSTAAQPTYADWTGLTLQGAGSRVEHVVLDWSRQGLAVSSSSPDIRVANTTVRHALWGCFSLQRSNGWFEDDVALDCGHEGFDINGHPHVLRGMVRASHVGFALLGGAPELRGNVVGEPIVPMGGATPDESGTVVDPALACQPPMAWRFESYVIPCQGQPYFL
jgi:hypothetical protein